MSESARIVLCPYCGNTQTQPDRCAECGGVFEPLSRRATQIAMGPWYIRDKSKPFRPGCSFDVVKKQVQAGKIKPTTIMRGPTTRQFWTVARHVPGVSHLLGYCYKCDAKVSPTDRRCPRCSAIFNEPWQRNELGLLYPSTNDANAAQKALEREIEAVLARGGTPAPGNITGPMTTPRPIPSPSVSPKPPGADLLDEVIGKPAAPTPKPASPPRAMPSPVPAAAPAPGAPSQPKPLDFTPSEESGRGESSSQARSNMLVLVLFILVILMLLVQVYNMFRPQYVLMSPPVPEETPLPPGPTPTQNDTKPTPPAPPPPPGKAFTPLQPSQPVAPRSETPAPVAPEAVAPAVVAPAPEVKAEAAKPAVPPTAPAEATAPEAKPAEPAVTPAVPAEKPAPPTSNSDFQGRLREAERLETSGKFAEALATFQVLSASSPDKKARAEVDAAIRRLEFKVQKDTAKVSR